MHHSSPRFRALFAPLCALASISGWIHANRLSDMLSQTAVDPAALATTLNQITGMIFGTAMALLGLAVCCALKAAGSQADAKPAKPQVG